MNFEHALFLLRSKMQVVDSILCYQLTTMQLMLKAMLVDNIFDIGQQQMFKNQ